MHIPRHKFHFGTYEYEREKLIVVPTLKNVQIKDSKCWICGQSPITGEHKIKKSDLELEFDPPSQENPLYYHTYDEKENVPYIQKIHSFKNNKLRMKTICAKCNNQVTQPHDKSWEQLSTALRNKYLKKNTVVVRTNKIFKYDTKKQMCNVHLYFVKHFGCYIINNAVPIDISTFATSILHNKAHPNLFLQFGVFARSNKKFAGVSQIETVSTHDGSFHIVEYIVCIGSLSVRVIVTKGEDTHSKFKNIIDNCWHPRLTSKIKIFNFNE